MQSIAEILGQEIKNRKAISKLIYFIKNSKSVKLFNFGPAP